MDFFFFTFLPNVHIILDLFFFFLINLLTYLPSLQKKKLVMTFSHYILLNHLCRESFGGFVNHLGIHSGSRLENHVRSCCCIKESLTGWWCDEARCKAELLLPPCGWLFSYNRNSNLLVFLIVMTLETLSIHVFPFSLKKTPPHQ